MSSGRNGRRTAARRGNAEEKLLNGIATQHNRDNFDYARQNETSKKLFEALAELGISVKSVSVLLTRARKQLREALGSDAVSALTPAALVQAAHHAQSSGSATGRSPTARSPVLAPVMQG